MKNKNVLVALAYIKESSNPLDVFCNYIIICLNKGKGYRMRHDEVAEAIRSEFGLSMPHHMIKMCCRILCNDKRIVRLKNGEGFELKDFSYDVSEFEKKREIFWDKERLVVNGLISFVEEFKCKWSYDDARRYLENFLILQGNAVTIFAEKNIEPPVKQNYIPPEWYIGKYISKLLERNEDERTQYLLDIINGLMIYIGVHETQDYNQDREQKFKGTTFFVDTKLLLRLMGYSCKLEIESAKELVNLIVNEYGGNIGVFEHTIGEVESALHNAAECLKRRDDIFDYELRMYSHTNNLDPYDFEIYEKSVRKIITDKLKFKVQDSVDWDKHSIINNNIANGEMVSYIKKRHQTWKDRAVINDVNTINHINILRRGDYSIKYGGKRKLPVFITTNTLLVLDIREYIKQYRDEDKGIANWRENALPIISDNMLMFRLWLPRAKNMSALPAMTLARNAYAAQQANTAFFDKIRKTAKELKGKHKDVDVINVSDLMKEKLEENLVKNTKGNIEELTTEILAMSLDEVVAFKTDKLNEKLKNKTKESDNKTIIIQKHKEQIITSAVKRYNNKLGIGWFVIKGAELFWLWIVLAFGIIELFISMQSETLPKNQLTIQGAIFVALFIAIKIFENILDRGSMRDKVIEVAVKYVWRKYSKKVESTLVGLELDYRNEILQACIEQTPILRRYQKYCGS